MTKVLPIDIEAFEALDWQRLLAVLKRAIDEEIVARSSGGRFGMRQEDRERLLVLSRQVRMIQEMAEIERGALFGTEPLERRRSLPET